MKQAKLLFLLIAALAFASCRPTARQAVADGSQGGQERYVNLLLALSYNY
jgi:hypothetical protein